MIASIERHREEIAHLCRRFGVRRLEVFGSAATGEFSATSDLDFLVTFEPDDPRDLFQRYFGLLEGLEKLFARKVDLVSTAALRNPYFIAAVERTRQTIYAGPVGETA